jgi:hypothetical protein
MLAQGEGIRQELIGSICLGGANRRVIEWVDPRGMAWVVAAEPAG